MLKNLITDLKLTAMNAVGEVKDLAHDLTTKLPDTVQKDFKVSDKQTIETNELSYMNGWNTSNSRMTATQIDMISDKVNFIAEMIQTELLGFDTIEEELRIIASQPNPPQPAQLMSLASRIDMTQRQVFEGLQKLRHLTVEIDKATDKLQGRVGNDWQTSSKNTGW